MKMTTSMSFGVFAKDDKNKECIAFYSTPVTDKILNDLWVEWNKELQSIEKMLRMTESDEGDFHTTSVRIEFITRDPKEGVSNTCSRILEFRSTDDLDEKVVVVMYCLALDCGGKRSSEFKNAEKEIAKRMIEVYEDVIAQAGNEEPLEPNDEDGKEV